MIGPSVIRKRISKCFSHKRIAHLPTPALRNSARRMKHRWMRPGFMFGGKILKRIGGGGGSTGTTVVNSGDDLQAAITAATPGTRLLVKSGTYAITGILQVPNGVIIEGEDRFGVILSYGATSASIYLMGNNIISGVYFERDDTGGAIGELFFNGPNIIVQNCILHGSTDVARIAGGCNNSTCYFQDNIVLECRSDLFQFKAAVAADSTHIATTACDHTCVFEFNRNFFYSVSLNQPAAFIGVECVDYPTLRVIDNYIDLLTNVNNKILAYLSFAGVCASTSGSVVTSTRNYVRLESIGTSTLSSTIIAVLFPSTCASGAYLPDITTTDDFFDFKCRGVANTFLFKGGTVGGGATSFGSVTQVRTDGFKQLNTSPFTDAQLGNSGMGGAGASQPTLTVSVAAAGIAYIFLPSYGYVSMLARRDATLKTVGSQAKGKRTTLSFVGDPNGAAHTITFSTGFSVSGGTLATSGTTALTVSIEFESDGTNMVEVRRYSTAV